MNDDESLLRSMADTRKRALKLSVRHEHADELEAMHAVLAVVRAHDRDGERRDSALHLAVMSAVSQLNLSAPAATCAFARDARDTLRQALIDYADAAMRAER